MIERLIVKNFPIIKYDFTKKTYLYFALVYFLFNFYLYYKKQYILIAFIGLFIIGYILNKENDRILNDEKQNFEELEKKMDVLITNKEIINHLYVDLNILELLYDIRSFRLRSNKMFNETVFKVNEFLYIYDTIKQSNEVSTEKLQFLSSVKNQALNNFHSILFRITDFNEIQKHNEFRYLLEERLNKLFLECLEMSTGHINLSDFAYNPNFNKYYDVY